MKRILLSCACCLLALGLVTACNNEDEEPNEPEVPGTVVDDGGSELATIKSGKLGLLYEENYHYLYFTGEVTDGFKGTLSESWSDGVSVTLAGTTESCYLSFEQNGSTVYVGGYTEGNYFDMDVESTPYELKYDSTNDAILTTDGNYYLGAYNGEYLRWMDSKYLGNEGDYTAHIYSSAQTNPTAPEPYVPTKPEVTEDYEYFFGFPTEGTAITGSVVGSYDYEGEITSDANEMVLVKLEEATAEGEEGGYYISFQLDSNVYYITIEVVEEDVYADEDTEHTGDVIGTKTYYDLAYAEEAAPLYWNETYGCWGTEDGECFLCYYSRYNCLYCSEISYVSSSPIAECIAPSEVSEVTISGPTSILIGEGDITLTATANAFAPLTEVTWTSSNTSVATVADGVVTGVTAGEVTITATSSNSISGSYTVTVSSPVDSELFGTYVFTEHVTGASSNALSADGLLADFAASWTAADTTENTDPLLSIGTCTRIYEGNSSTSGWVQGDNSKGYIKTGSSGNPGEMELNFSTDIAKVVINCHAWTTSSSDTVAVNGFAAKAASTTGTATDLEFNLIPSTDVDIVFTDRVFIASIAIYVPATDAVD